MTPAQKPVSPATPLSLSDPVLVALNQISAALAPYPVVRQLRILAAVCAISGRDLNARAFCCAAAALEEAQP
jgi:hypothetical protein